MNIKSKFDFNEIVEVDSDKKNLLKYRGSIGVIRGKSQSEENPSVFAYSVDILNKQGEVIACKFIYEEDLYATGKRADPKDLFTVESVRVRVDPKTGEGEIVEKE